MKKIFSSRIILLPLTAMLLILASCDKNDDAAMITPPAVQGPDINFFALTANNRILLINGKTTNTAASTLNITGLQSGETILGIDFRPNTGQLFGIGSSSRLYVINKQTGAATAVGTAPFTPALSGTTLAFDFNPTVDRIRVVTSAGQNLRLNPETGAVAAVDGTINGAAGAAVNAAAYTQSRAGAVTTVLYDIDVTNNKLYRQDPPNAGTLAEVGNLGVDAEGAGGFDISADSAYALAALTVGGVSGLYTINLATGAATKAGNFSEQITGLAIPTQAVAYAITGGTNLQILDPTTGTISFTKAVTGLQAGETLLGIDMRPATGQLFALGSSSRLYSINIGTGAATLTGAGAFTPALSGTDFGFDFNPTVDRIRIISNTGQNLRINPADGVVTMDTNISPAASSLTAAAYSNSFAGATATVLYNIDAMTDRLVKQDSPNTGVVTDLGALGVNVEASNGFDISGTGTVAYGIFTVGGAARIYSINLTTGAATSGPAFAQGVTGFTLALVL